MTVSLIPSCFVVTSLLVAAAPSLAQSADTPPSTLTVFGAQRFWFATQSVKLLDATVAPPATPGGAPQLRTRLGEATASAVVPVTALGLRYGSVLGTVSLSPSTGFGADGQLAGGQIHRQEFDLSVGYAALPSTTVSLIYKRGKIDPTVTQAGQTLLGLSDTTGKGNAVLLGVSTGAPLHGAVSLYANLAYGAGRWTSSEVPGSSTRYPSRYTVADFGLAWRAGGPANVTLQLGYRSQIVTLKNVELPVYALAAQPQLLSTTRINAPSTTQGAIFSVAAAF